MNILILSASTGGGHLRASSALKSYILENEEEAVIEIVDTLKYISPLLNKTITEGYEYLAKNGPKVFGAMYRSTNKKNHLKSIVVSFNQLFSKRLLPLIDEFKPDIIISTHPFSTEMVSNLKGLGSVSVPLICIMTDYAPHRTWLNENVDAYVVSNESMINVMEDMGVDEKIIYPFGIPIDNMFHFKEDKAQILEELGLKQNIPTILIMAGSFGVTDILKIYTKIVEIKKDFQIIVITGKNKKLYESFEKIISKDKKNLKDKNLNIRLLKDIKKKTIRKFAKISNSFNNKNPKSHKNTKLVFFTQEVHKYMQVADLIITKPGGLTVSEALACNLPMAIFNAIPGQEEENADFLINNNMAVKISKDSTCADIIENLIFNSGSLKKMKSSCEKFDKSNSCKNILELIYKLTTRNKA